MGRKLVCDDKIQTMDEYFKSYGFHQKLLRLDRYERRYFGYEDSVDALPGDLTLVRAKMYEVRHFIMSLENGDEKLFLYYHYIRGEAVEKCAELLGVARCTGFRLKKRALMRAYEHLETKKRQDKSKM